jgi:hypothetical protein
MSAPTAIELEAPTPSVINDLTAQIRPGDRCTETLLVDGADLFVVVGN